MSVEWAQKIFLPSVEGDERFVLFCDNLTSQVSDDFKECVSQLNGVVWYMGYQMRLICGNLLTLGTLRS